jgi:hypothetical protein
MSVKRPQLSMFWFAPEASGLLRCGRGGPMGDIDRHSSDTGNVLPS